MATPQPHFEATFPSLAHKNQKEHKMKQAALSWATLKPTREVAVAANFMS